MIVSVVIPSFRAKQTIIDVIKGIPASVTSIYVVDDGCPDKTGRHVRDVNKDKRVTVIENAVNQGVGGATLTGFKAAFNAGADLCIKVDSDGQHNPKYIKDILDVYKNTSAGYVKGSRFIRRGDIGDMPKYRIFLNAILSFTNKFASGYYTITDPTNGFIALDQKAHKAIDSDKVAKRYFFESDILFHLNLARQTVAEFPMQADYNDEESGLKLRSEALNFAFGNIANFLKRIWIRHFILSFSVAGIYFLMSAIFIFFALLLGAIFWIRSIQSGIPATSGTVMIPAVLSIVGINFFTSFLLFDANDEPGGKASR